MGILPPKIVINTNGAFFFFVLFRASEANHWRIMTLPAGRSRPSHHTVIIIPSQYTTVQYAPCDQLGRPTLVKIKWRLPIRLRAPGPYLHTTHIHYRDYRLVEVEEWREETVIRVGC